jgi:hypothetical protein
MTRMFAFLGATIGGYAGWAAGESFGIFTAFVVSMVLTAAGGYYGRKIGKHYGGRARCSRIVELITQRKTKRAQRPQRGLFLCELCALCVSA